MLKKNTVNRPDHQLEGTLSALVYTVVAMALGLFMLFVYPQYSLYLIVLILLITVLCIALAIRIMSASEEALTYGGFANEILNSREIINRIDNNKGEPIIENQAAKKFFSGEPVLESLHKNLEDSRQNQLNFQRLEVARKNLKKEKVTLQLVSDTDDSAKWYTIALRPLYLKKSDIFEEEFSIEKIQKETYFFWTLEDVTAAKNMEKIFEEERKKLHYFIHHMPVGIYVADADYNLEYVNESFALQLGCTRDELTAKSFKELVAHDDGILNPRRPSYTGMAVFHKKGEGKGQNQELFVLQNNFKEGNAVKIRGLTIQNLPTDAELQNELDYATDEIDWLFATSPSGIVFIDKNGIILKNNYRAAEILKETSKEIVGEKLSSFFRPPTVKMLQDIYQTYVKDSANREMHKIESRLKSDKIVRIYTAPQRRMRGADNALEGMVLYLEDTTEQKNLELKFAQAQKMQAMGQLAGGVAHDFNNLLTAMIGFCDLLLQRHGVGDPSFADLIQIKQNANRAAGLVRQLLAFSRKQPLKPKRIDVTENFIELSHMLRRILGEQITLEFNHGNDLGFIRVDPVQFSQVILNLAVNAKDAMNGRGVLRISTRTEKLSEPYQFGADTIMPGDFVVINVSDTGCGIPPENLSRIFEPFFSTKQNVVGSGTGLGLAMVYGIVRQTEGFIKVDSVVGKGTTFSIHLPRFETADEDTDASSARVSGDQTPVLTSASASGQPPKIIFGLNVTTLDRGREQTRNPQEIKILFAEDEDSVRAFGVRALKKKGFNVAAANNAENALELLDKGEKFDLLITDMVMPGLSGAELAREIKKRLPEVRIILASGYSEEIARRELAGSEDFEFISKPYSLGDLTKKVFDVLNR